MPQSIQAHPNSSMGKLMIQAFADLDSKTLIGNKRAMFMLRGMGLTEFKITKN